MNLCSHYESLTNKKRLLDSLGPLPFELISNLDAWFETELTYASNAIEGNTLTRQETALVLEKRMVVGGKRLNEHIEAVNHLQAMRWIKERITNPQRPFKIADILTIHQKIRQSIDDTNGGRLRTIAVKISGS